MREPKSETLVRLKLEGMGFRDVEFFAIARGSETHARADRPCRWEAHAINQEGRKVIIDGGASLTECSRRRVKLDSGGIAYGQYQINITKTRKALSTQPETAKGGE